MRAVVVFCLLVVAACTERPQYAAATSPETRSTPRTLEVAGEGTAISDPRRATFTAVLTSRAVSPSEAVNESKQAERRLLNQLEAAGVRPADVIVKNYDLRLASGVRLPPTAARQEEDLGEYLMTRRLRVTVLDLDALQRVVNSTMSSEGVAYIEEVSFAPANEGMLKEAAHQLAMRDAEARAQTMAQELGMQLGLPEEIVEVRFSAPGARPDEPFQAFCQVRVKFSLRNY